MITVGVEALQPGMVLARSVVNEAGITLFGRGAVLTSEEVERVRTAGVRFVSVEGKRPPRRSLEEEVMSLDQRFGKVDREPHMAGIKALVLRHIRSLYG